MTMNVLAYGFSLLSARVLGPRSFGEVSSLLGVLIVASVGALALQATAARRLATTPPQQRGAVTADVLRNARRVAAAFAGVLLLAAPVLHQALHLDSWLSAALPAGASVPLTMMGAYAGVLQGERRWRALAAVFAGLGAGRLLAGGIAVLVSPTVTAAMIGVTLGAFVPAVLGALSMQAGSRSATGADHQPVLRELWTNGHILLAFFAFTNLDVLLARHLLDQNDAGIYAAGAILAKACLFMPTFVLVVAFPDMARDRSGRPWLKPLLAVAALGVLATVGAGVIPDLAVAFAGGSEYAELADVAWLFAAEGTLFACLQILVYDTIAGQSHAGSALWLGTAVVVIVALVALDSVLAIVATVAMVAAAVGLVTACLTSRVPDPANHSVTRFVPGATHPD
ncbi:MAG: polysaccharide biosynthesis protein, partial [Propionibacteriales bacterium]|nr:polysaccharide biosynthesis protein [Propionibacteriales bacterium]